MKTFSSRTVFVLTTILWMAGHPMATAETTFKEIESALQDAMQDTTSFCETTVSKGARAIYFAALNAYYNNNIGTMDEKYNLMVLIGRSVFVDTLPTAEMLSLENHLSWRLFSDINTKYLAARVNNAASYLQQINGALSSRDTDYDRLNRANISYKRQMQEDATRLKRLLDVTSEAYLASAARLIRSVIPLYYTRDSSRLAAWVAIDTLTKRTLRFEPSLVDLADSALKQETDSTIRQYATSVVAAMRALPVSEKGDVATMSNLNSIPTVMERAPIYASVKPPPGYASDGSDCDPPCRAGFYCQKGNCVSECSPPCHDGELCQNGRCADVSPRTKSSGVPPKERKQKILKKCHKHTGFYLSFNIGFGSGSIQSSFDSSAVKTLGLSGPGSTASFSIGGAIRENVILFAEFPSMIGLIQPSMKVNDSLNRSDREVVINSEIFGAGLSYYISPYNILVSGVFGAALNDLDKTSDTPWPNVSYHRGTGRSDLGYGFKIRTGKEWWRSPRWALGAVGFYQFSSVRSGEVFPETGKMASSFWGVCFSATFN